MKENILKEYKDKKLVFEAFESRVINLLEDLIRQNHLNVHQITSRVKDFDSLSKKLDRKIDKYNSISDITDVVGVRIITYMESEVNLVASIIGKEFSQDKENSIDKRLLKTDQFGYKSLHVVVELSRERCKLTEYRPYENIKCEIQIRSILQHAWAEIEHDLGYKSEFSIPDTQRRNFNRLAALLETADIEFDRLRNDLLTYEQQVAELIENVPEDVTINKASIDSLIKTNPIFQAANKIIIKNTGAELYDDSHYDSELERFSFFKINTIKELEDLLATEGDAYLAFVDEFTKGFINRRLSSNLPFYYFQHYLASKTGNPQTVVDYFTFITPNIDTSGDPGSEFVEIYKRSKNRS